MNFTRDKIFLVLKKLVVLSFFSGYSFQACFSQDFTKIHLDEIPQRRIRNYIVSRKIDKMNDFSMIHPSWNNEINESDYKVIEKTFFLKYGLSDVWGFYQHANTFKMWNARSIRFGLLITKFSNSVVYSKNPSCPEVDTGQVYFLNIKLMRGVFNIPVAFEIITIDQIHRIVEFSYIDNNKSRGKQSMQFLDDGEGRTRIVHRSFFKSESAFRDDFLYPYFHKKFIRGFHANMKQLIKNQSIYNARIKVNDNIQRVSSE
jgi:hypothetical protein